MPTPDVAVVAARGTAGLCYGELVLGMIGAGAFI
jgi:hypothetical protein